MGFCLGFTVQSQTKGIWTWCVPHPTNPSHSLIPRDTESLGDVKKEGQSLAMASENIMPSPVCLIENVKGQLRTNQEALSILSAIHRPVVVVAIVGLYRTGKSYLMNKLAGKKTGFSLGSTVQSQTKGIWMWCVPHPQKPDDTLVLLDTEGLGDVAKGDNQNDCWIFALAILLSSTFVYNSMGAINQHALDQLQCSPDHPELEDSDEYVSFFPDFVWTLRDFSLELKINGQSISADEYLENSLKLLQGTSQKEKEKKLNLPRLCIRKFFPTKKCFVFERPAPGKKLGQLESLQDQDLDSDFVVQVAEFCSYVYRSSKVKRISGGLKVNGPRLNSLVTTYVNSISNGCLPCMENAVLALAETENSAALQKAIAHYDQQMSQRVQLPTKTLQELLDLHRTCEKEATKIFMEHSFKDVNQVFLTKLEMELEKKQGEFCKKNQKVSSDHCLSLLRDIFGPLEEDVKQGVYYKPRGYSLFNQKIQELKKKYYEEPGKGVQAEEALKEFLQTKEDITEAILQTDQSLTEKERVIEVERVKAEAAESASKLLEEMRRKNEQLMEQKEQIHQERMEQLREKMEREQEQLREEQRRAMEHKIWEEKKIKQECEKLREENEDLREKAEHKCVIS
ncbi:Guanylate-binding protein 1 [Apodemus speciosus]|uniref:Guanylate-binding protein 1 n=1 Tax=Apodemus speciosus TaxID=105296 RepID=A0ABQ0EM74_APOSI